MLNYQWLIKKIIAEFALFTWSSKKLCLSSFWYFASINDLMLLWTVHIWAIVEAPHRQLADFVSFRYLNVIDDLAKPPLSMWPKSGWIRIPSKLKSNAFSKRKRGKESVGLATYRLVVWGFEIRREIRLGQWVIDQMTILQACHMCRPMKMGIFPLQPTHRAWPNQICGQFLWHNASFVVSSAPARNGPLLTWKGKKLQVGWGTYLGNIIFSKGTCVPCIHNFQKDS